MNYSYKKRLFYIWFIFIISLLLCVVVCFTSCASINLENLDSLPLNSTMYDNKLAHIAADLSEAAEEEEDGNICNEYARYGIEDVWTSNYKKGWWDFDYGIYGVNAFSFGKKNINIQGNDTTVVFVTCRGTKTLSETANDLLKGKDQDFFGYKVYENPYNFAEEAYNGLKNYCSHFSIKNLKSLKLFISGHSLGGAAANVLSAKISLDNNRFEFLPLSFSKQDIFTYTFGGIKVITDSYSGKNASSGFENIHNLYNEYDSYGPKGVNGIFGVSSEWQKFGHTETFSINKHEWFLGFESHLMGTYKEALCKQDKNNNYLSLTCSGKDSDKVLPDNNKLKLFIEDLSPLVYGSWHIPAKYDCNNPIVAIEPSSNKLYTNIMHYIMFYLADPAYTRINHYPVEQPSSFFQNEKDPLNKFVNVYPYCGFWKISEESIRFLLTDIFNCNNSDIDTLIDSFINNTNNNAYLYNDYFYVMNGTGKGTYPNNAYVNSVKQLNDNTYSVEFIYPDSSNYSKESKNYSTMTVKNINGETFWTLNKLNL